MKQLTDWLYYTKAERRGILVLILLLIGISIAPKLYPYFIKKKDNSKLIKQRVAELEKKHRLYDSLQLANRNQSKKYITNESKANTYPSKGKIVNQPLKENASKLDKQSIELEVEDQQSTIVQKDNSKNYNIDINSASAQDFAKLKGIGEVFSNRIVKYRDALGGFISVEQVGTTYGIDSDTFTSIKGHLSISSNFKPKQINFNTSSVEQLAKHPYISKKLANQVVNYRNKVNPFNSEEDVKKLYLIDDVLYQKLAPYITY